MKQNIMDGYNIGDTMFDPLEKKRKNKETVPEMEFLSKLGNNFKHTTFKPKNFLEIRIYDVI